MSRFERLVQGQQFRLFGKVWFKLNNDFAENGMGETIAMHPNRRVRSSF